MEGTCGTVRGRVEKAESRRDQGNERPGDTVHDAQCEGAGILLIFIYTMVIDKILVMGAQKIEVKIISSKYEEIRKAILTNVDRGVTMLHGQTGYLLENTEVLINVISTRELVQVERIVKSIDEDAFMIISNVHEVQGRGFNLEKEYIEK